MKRTVVLALIAVLTILALAGGAAAQSQPSSKATAKVGTIAILDQTDMAWTTVLANNIRTPNQKDLFIDVSLECGLYTKTLVKSAGSKDTAKAEAGVYVQVLVDGDPAYPGEVVFCRRTQELTALFGGIMEACTDLNGDGIITYDECTWTPEELELVLDTMNANSFNFILDDLSSGVHTVEVQARISSVTEAGAGAAEAKATIGKGSMTVEEVRLIQNEDIVLP